MQVEEIQKAPSCVLSNFPRGKVFMKQDHNEDIDADTIHPSRSNFLVLLVVFMCIINSVQFYYPSWFLHELKRFNDDGSGCPFLTTPPS